MVMKAFKTTVFLRFFCAAFFFAGAYAQELSSPNIAYVYPAGGQRGSVFKMTIGGSKFSGVDRIFFSTPSISAKILELTIPFTEGQRAQLRMKLEKEYILSNPGMKEKIEAMGKDGQAFLRRKTMEIPENKNQIYEADASEYLRVVSTDAMADTVEIEVSVAPDAPLGIYSVMLAGPNGISNPAKISISDLPEKSKQSLRRTAYERARTKEYWGRAVARARWPKTFVKPGNNEPVDVDLPVIVNGQITEGNTDFWRFKAKKGQKIVMSVSAQSLLPYISDAVPGWFQTALRVRNSKGEELAYNDDFYHRPDSHLVFDVPADGEYCVEIFDAVHRGREDFVYRLLIGEVPFVESVFPLGVVAGETCEVELNGVNLREKTARIARGIRGEFEFEYSKAYHNRIPLDSGGHSIMSAAESAHREGKKYGGAAQELTIPALVDGRIVEKKQTDIFKFDLVHGKKVVIETFARRLDSPLDTYLVLTDSNGKILASADDFEDLSRGYVTHHADSRMEFVAPATGTYILRLTDASGQYSDSHSYRLSISHGRGDFTVVASPSVLNMRNGGSAAIKLKAFRRNGFNGPISVELKNLPKDWKYYGGKIESGSDEGEIVVTASPKTGKKILPFRAVATSHINGWKTSRKVVPSEDMMQAFYYRHYVPFESFYACSGNDGGHLQWFRHLRIEPPKDLLKIPLGKSASVRIASFSMRNASRLVGAVSGTDKLSAARFFAKKNDFFAVIKADSKTAKVGDKGEFTLVMNMKVGRKIFNIDRVPGIKFEIVDANAQPNADKKAGNGGAKKDTKPKAAKDKGGAESSKGKSAAKTSKNKDNTETGGKNGGSAKNSQGGSKSAPSGK